MTVKKDFIFQKLERIAYLPFTRRYFFASKMNAMAIQPSQIAREGEDIIHKYVEARELFWFVEEPIFTKIRSRVRLTILAMSASRDTVLQPGSSTFNLLGNETNSSEDLFV